MTDNGRGAREWMDELLARGSYRELAERAAARAGEDPAGAALARAELAWLGAGPVYDLVAASADEVVTLRPLHARHLSGALAIEVGQFLVELRLRKRWDAGIPRSCVLVHRAQSNVSYLMQRD